MNVAATFVFLVFSAFWALFSFLVISRLRTVRYKGDKSVLSFSIFLGSGVAVIMATLLALL